MSTPEPEVILTPSGEEASGKAFTVKAVLCGLAGAAFINAFGGFNDEHLRSSLFVGNHLPISTVFMVIVLVAFYNPLVSLVHRGLMFTTRELTVTLGLTLVGCWSATSGFYRYFHRQLIMPWFYHPSKKEWRYVDENGRVVYDMLGYIQKDLWPLGEKAQELGKPLNELTMYETVYGGFLTGLSKGGDTILPWSDVLTQPPVNSEGNALIEKATGLAVEMSVWEAWFAPMVYWGPLLVAFTVAILALALLVHRQWAHHEQLSYPLAAINLSLIDREPDKRLPKVFYSSLFLWGAGAVFLFHLIRLGHVWYPNEIPTVYTSAKMDLTKLFPDLTNVGGGGWSLTNVKLFFTIVGVTYFLSSEIGFTMGTCNIILIILCMQYYSVTGTPVSDENLRLARGGAYIAYAAILVYTGRTYYWAVFKKAFLTGGATEMERDGVTAARLLLLSFAAFVVILCLMGLDWLVALLFAGMTMLFFLVFTRIICETGIPFMQANWYPGVLMTKVFGAAAIGPAAMAFTYWMSTILAQDPRECMMPYVSTSLKIADDTKVNLGRFTRWAFISIMIALAVGFFVKGANYYNFGGFEDGWAGRYVPVRPFDWAARSTETLHNNQRLADAEAASGLQKISLISPDHEALAYVVLAMAGVIVFSMMRFRFTWWPLHPVLFCVWSTYPMTQTMYSFLIGWMIKELIVRFAGGKVYQDLKPLFLGLVIGELLAGALGILIGVIYYLVTGNQPQGFAVLPG